MNFSATNAAPDFSFGRKPFIALGEKLSRRRRFCNQAEGKPLIILRELMTRQLEAWGRCFTTVAKKGADRADLPEPVGMGWLMNKVNFVPSATRLKKHFADEVKKRNTSGDHSSGSGENARVSGRLAGFLVFKTATFARA
jgi:hypothetical protein